ncbi:unannotated protein [freshwater metagenome]|uniref:Unannotated protein n=1 Tax=freshwater metagenome TaxID=449393 RepID=A0A6J6BB30_9ZZZZ|nr:polyketide cyclase / dehydrase and lipid transport [Actinomycetota bacterium]
MDNVRAEILKVDFPLTAAARITINAPAQKIFDYLADPYAHAYFDGSGTVQRALRAPDRLALGSKFGMGMKIYIPYRITNKVVAFTEGSLITWRHLGGWTWSYELRETGNGQTVVTEIFDVNPAPAIAQWWVRKTHSLERNPKWMAKSLVLLKALSEQ